MVRTGEAQFGPIGVIWSVPKANPDASAGLEHLPEAVSAAPHVSWHVRAGDPGPPPRRYGAFYGSARVSLRAPDHVEVWSPGVAFRVSSAGADGLVSGPALLGASLALHAVAAFAGLVHTHAALVRVAGRVVLLPGGSGAGKSTVSLAVALHGGELLADDAVYVDQERVAWPVRRAPHATRATLRALPGLQVLGPVDDDAVTKFRVRPPIQGPAAPAAIDAVLAPTIARSGETHIQDLEGTSLFPILLGSSALAVVERSPHREQMIDQLASIAEVRGGRLVLGPDALLEPARIACTIERWLDP